MEMYHGEKMFEKTFIHPCVKLSHSVSSRHQKLNLMV